MLEAADATAIVIRVGFALNRIAKRAGRPTLAQVLVRGFRQSRCEPPFPATRTLMLLRQIRVVEGGGTWSPKVRSRSNRTRAGGWLTIAPLKSRRVPRRASLISDSSPRGVARTPGDRDAPQSRRWSSEASAL